MCKKKTDPNEFTEYMEAQIAEIVKSGLTSKEWVEKHAETFRENYGKDK
jgi:hypothetical protein